MTEDEAKSRWCPMGAKPMSSNTLGYTTMTSCIGSKCMMWQWDKFNEWQTAKWTGQYIDEKGNLIVETSGTPTGYCGLARKI